MSKESRVRAGGLYRCCVQTVVDLQPEYDREGYIVDCAFEYSGNHNLIFVNGAWQWYDRRGASDTVVK